MVLVVKKRKNTKPEQSKEDDIPMTNYMPAEGMGPPVSENVYGTTRSSIETKDSTIAKHSSTIKSTNRDMWDIDPKDLKINEEIGRGAYGVVFKGTWRKTPGFLLLNTT